MKHFIQKTLSHFIPKARKHPNRQCSLRLESLETRLTPAVQPELAAPFLGNNLVIISQELVGQVPQQEFANVSVATLDGNKDAISQISGVLASHSGLQTIRIISHGANGTLLLGNQPLNENVLANRASEIASWGKSLAPGADLLLYGCSVAGSESGRSFVNTLAQLTGADVAASDNPTGAGGDTILEYSHGVVQAGLLASSADWNSSHLQLLDYTYTSNGSAVTITGYTGSGGAITIPNSIDGLPVTTIGSSAFFNRTNITSVTIPNSVTSVGQQAFLNCTNLASVSIPNSVTSIGQQAFLNCTGLVSISIPNSVTSIGFGAFQSCSSLASVSIGSSVTTIGTSAFYGCTSLTSIQADANNLNFSSADGILFNKLQTNLIQFPGGKAGIIIIPSTVTSISSSSFQNCSNITSVSMGSGIASIGNFAFSGCTRLTTVNIPATVLSLGSSSFQGCTSLTSISIPSSVTSIGSASFQNCSSLTAIHVDANNANFSSADGILFNKLQTNLIQCPGGKVGNAFVPMSVTTISSTAFQACSKLSSITVDASNLNFSSTDGILFNKLQTNLIQCPGGKVGDAFVPGSVTSISFQAFQNCSNLSSITVDASNLNFSSTDGILFNKLQTNLIQCPGGKVGNAFVPGSVTSISFPAFQNCSNLSSITVDASNLNFSSADGILFNKLQTNLIQCPGGKVGDAFVPGSVTSINFQAFQNCSKLSSITVDTSNLNFSSADGILFNKLQTILLQCPAGKSGGANIPVTVTSISDGAFQGSTGLHSIYFLGNAPSLGLDVFQGVSATVYYLQGASGFTNLFGGLTTALFTIAPKELVLSNATLNENGPVGMVVGTLNTTNGGVLESFTYSLVAGTGDTDNAAFTIEGNSLILAASANFEIQSAYSVRIRSTDASGHFIEQSFEISITDANDAPVAHTQSIDTIEDTFFANGILSGSDEDGGQVTYAIASQGTKGVVTITNANTGTFTYTPNPDANGSDSFSFKVNDGAMDSAITMVTINIAPINDAPLNTVPPVINQTAIRMGAELTVSSGTWNDDKDGNPGMVFSYQWFQRNHKGQVISISGATLDRYTIQPGDFGKFIWVEVTCTDQGTPGSISVTARSNEVRLIGGNPHRWFANPLGEKEWFHGKRDGRLVDSIFSCYDPGNSHHR